jgi:hypothetical protein
MRKIKLLALFVFAIILTACGLVGNDFEKALDNMEETQSFRMDIKMENVPFFGTIAGYMLVEGEYQYTSFLGEENFSLTLDGINYDIIEFLGENYAFEIIDDDIDDFELDESVYDEFNGDNFTKNDDGYYVSDINYGEMTNVKVKVENGYFSELTAKIDSDGFVIDITLEFSGFNSTTIDFPDFEYMDDYTTILYNIVEEGMTYTETLTGFNISDWSDTIVYENGNNYYVIEDWYADLYFYPETQEVVDGNNAYSVSEYFENELYPPFDEIIFELLTELYNEME